MTARARKRTGTSRLLDPCEGLSPVPLDLVVGRGIKKIRTSKGLSQHDLASLANRYGVGWSRVAVANVERGARSVPLGELLLLAHALQVAPVDLLEGLDPGEAAMITPEATSTADGLHYLLTGQGEPGLSAPETRMLVELGNDAISMFEGYKPLWPEANAGQLLAAHRAADGAAETKAASDLGLDPVALSVLAHRRWGRGLTAERDRRLTEVAPADTPEMALRVMRGQVVKKLLEELEPDLAPARAKGARK